MEAIRAFPLVKKVKSFLTSTSNTFKHVLIFTGSFNDRTNLIAAAAPPSPPQEAPRDPFDIESRRVSKSVQPVCLSVASASLMLLVNLPKEAETGGGRAVLYGAHLACICLGVFSSLGLSMYSVTVARAGEPRVAEVQKKVMVAAVALVLASVVLRMLLTLPPAALKFALLFFFVGAGAVAVYVVLTWSGERTPAADNSADLP